MKINNVQDIRNHFIYLKSENKIAENNTYEIINASFIADEDIIFGKQNLNYIKKEIAWYMKESLHIKDIGEDIPKIWQNIANTKGLINSNYGWCIFSKENYHQFNFAVNSLFKDISSRQAVMIYNRPTMHFDAVKDGMSDFICTYATQLLIRDNTLHYIVNMRSNDVIYGYNNDKYWHKIVMEVAHNTLLKKYPELKLGNMFWNAGSLHIYQKHFHLIQPNQEANL